VSMKLNTKTMENLFCGPIRRQMVGPMGERGSGGYHPPPLRLSSDPKWAKKAHERGVHFTKEKGHKFFWVKFPH